MTHDERISAYIDNELNGDQEQEFLISLAASEGLRKSFRSELVLKNVLHRDESATNPPRRLRAAVFTTLGLGAASAIGASKATAAEAQHTVSMGLVKSLFATKLSTAVTLALLTSSALVGYGVRTVTAPNDAIPSHTISAPTMGTSGTGATAAPVTQPSVTTEPSPARSQPDVDPTQSSVASSTQPAHHTGRHSLAAQHRTEPGNTTNSSGQVSGVAGGAPITMEPAKIGH